MADGKDNKLMANAGVEARRPGQESICLPIAEHDRNDTNLKPKKRWRLRTPYAINSFIALVVVVLMNLLEIGYIPQTKLGYYCKDPSISHQYTGDTVSMTLLLVGCILGPLIIILGVETDRSGGVSKTCARAVWKWYKELLLGVALCLCFIQVAKVIVGEHRPHFLHTCRPDTEDYCKPGEYMTEYKCTSSLYSNYLILDSSRSFPSGHSAASVFVAVFSGVYIHFRYVNQQLGSLFKLLLIFLCVLWALMCSLTRIIDHRHHWWDVLIGTIIGVFCAAYTIVVFCNSFQPQKKPSSPRPSTSTTTLLDVKNKDSTSVII